MKVTITVDLDEQFLSEVAEHALRASLARPSHYDGKGSPGYERIARAAQDYVRMLDVTELIRATAERMVDGIVRDVVGEFLRRRVREAVRIQQEDGVLFPRTPAKS